MAKIHYEVVPAGGSERAVTDVICTGGLKGWRFVSVVAGDGQSYVVFEVPKTEHRAGGGASTQYTP
jgi:hypothetical protein